MLKVFLLFSIIEFFIGRNFKKLYFDRNIRYNLGYANDDTEK